ncbi:RagB/SusD family nutrient uptake outer membrane protein [Aestuariibaculum suncheonense]|uniref:RagB/SusD family nutrient uptake outer membrane protein n=1 Tax=Aestuariibaculum suncheonense TaxID=1028745 RepID=A0A8J6Q5X6_9FLAO|nr:RagB/SusD family nutrient uptake outer membrane protein [Aestuariibaculum suncheonense]MBD0834596.1 RagB/SusD family nutrient uptake outer membrane protein [Aestuariibaculum suncheonense]
MKKNIIYILFISITLYACSDFLEQEPGEQISIEEQLSNKNGILAALNGIYRDIEDILSSRHAIYADVQGGNITFTPSTVTNLVEIPTVIENSYNFSDLEDESNYADYYAAFYDIINQGNILLFYLPEFTFLTSEEQQQLEAELLTIRAFAHYQLSIHYAQNYNFTSDASHLGIVYNTAPLTIGEDFPSRLTMSETYDHLKSDLNEALELYTENQSLAGPVYSYFNTNTTKALYARIALQMNDWETAFSMSDAVIKTSGISLTSKENYITEWEAEEISVSEVILEFSAPRTTEGQVSSSISEHFIYNSSNNYGRYVASGDLANLYDNGDIRKDMFLEVSIPTNTNNILTNEPYYFTKKFQGNPGTPFIRLSEIYLIRAEANARLEQLNSALTDLNTIRERANLAALTDTSNILEDIFTERRKELAFEGHLLFDLIRFKKDVTRNLGCISTVCGLTYPSNNYILPIPSSSTDFNENIIQNEGY